MMYSRAQRLLSQKGLIRSWNSLQYSAISCLDWACSHYIQIEISNIKQLIAMQKYFEVQASTYAEQLSCNLQMVLAHERESPSPLDCPCPPCSTVRTRNRKSAALKPVHIVAHRCSLVGEAFHRTKNSGGSFQQPTSRDVLSGDQHCNADWEDSLAGRTCRSGSRICRIISSDIWHVLLSLRFSLAPVVSQCLGSSFGPRDCALLTASPLLTSNWRTAIVLVHGELAAKVKGRTERTWKFETGTKSCKTDCSLVQAFLKKQETFCREVPKTAPLLWFFSRQKSTKLEQKEMAETVANYL